MEVAVLNVQAAQHAAAAAVARLSLSDKYKAAEVLAVLCPWLLAPDPKVPSAPAPLLVHTQVSCAPCGVLLVWGARGCLSVLRSKGPGCGCGGGGWGPNRWRARRGWRCGSC